MTPSRVPYVVFATAAVLLAAVVVHDFAVPINREWGTRAALAAIGQYRQHVSPRLKGRVTCRFEPTCSFYGQESVRKYGLAAGGWRTLKRIASCTPATPPGTIDPP